MKKNRRFLRITLTLISLLLVATMLSSCGVITLLLPMLLPSTDGVDFNSIQYERPDFNAIEEAFLAIIEDLEKGRSSLTLQRSLSNAYSLYNDAQTQYSIAEIRYYSNVNDTEAKDEIAYCTEKFAELDPIVNQLYNAIIDNGYQDDLLYGWTDRDFEYIEIQEKMFDDEYTALMAERAELENEYMAIPSQITFTLSDGKSYSIDALYEKYLFGEITPQQYNEYVQGYYNQINSKAAPIYMRLVEIDNTLAAKAELDSYAEYSYKFIYQRDYTPDDVADIYEYVREDVVPLYFEVLSMIDSEVLNQALAKSNATLSAYDSILTKYTAEISDEMSAAYRYMKKYNLYNVGGKEGMQMAGFTTYLYSYEMPYIYLYTYGSLDDITSFVHEFGHFYGFYHNGFESDSIIDVSEIQSQADEWLFVPYYDLTEEESEQYILHRLSETLLTIIEGCLYDEFQQEMHRQSDEIKSGDEINKLFLEIATEYRYDEVYPSGIVPNLWSTVHHNFTAPFYYISYTMSAIPALEIFILSQEDRKEAIDVYNNVIDETGYRSYLDVLDDLDLGSPLEKEVYRDITDWAEEYLAKQKSTAGTPVSAE